MKQLALDLPSSAWKHITWRSGTQEKLRSRFAAVRVRPAHGDEKLTVPRPEEWLLIEWPKKESEPTRYWLSTLPAETSLKRSGWRSRAACFSNFLTARSADRHPDRRRRLPQRSQRNAGEHGVPFARDRPTISPEKVSSVIDNARFLCRNLAGVRSWFSTELIAEHEILAHLVVAHHVGTQELCLPSYSAAIGWCRIAAAQTNW